MKAIIRARVSTKEQEEGHSIAAQRQRLVHYCAASGYSAAPFCWAKIRPEELRQALIAEVALTGALGEDIVADLARLV
jgi:DNA invertase Pin-like site-specific DNA recombinase